MAKEIKVDISELKFDNNNYNEHTEFGMQMIEKSLQNCGFGRSVLLDKENNIIAGNATIETAGQVGFNKVRIIETDGTEIIAVKRTDLSIDDKKAKELALYDNRTSEVNLKWDETALKEDFDAKELNEKWNLKFDEEVDFSDKNKEINTDEFSDKMEIKLQFTANEFQFVQMELSKINANKELAILKLLKYDAQV